jgi:hypothetical protein
MMASRSVCETLILHVPVPGQLLLCNRTAYIDWKTQWLDAQILGTRFHYQLGITTSLLLIFTMYPSTLH